jgi:hypothetical protein
MGAVRVAKAKHDVKLAEALEEREVEVRLVAVHHEESLFLGAHGRRQQRNNAHVQPLQQALSVDATSAREGVVRPGTVCVVASMGCDMSP